MLLLREGDQQISETGRPVERGSSRDLKFRGEFLLTAGRLAYVRPLRLMYQDTEAGNTPVSQVLLPTHLIQK